jgi:hypothetical protein
MYLLYLDDSGSASTVSEEYFVLGGVCVPEQSTRWLSHQLEQVALALPAANPAAIELHASETFGGRQEWAKQLDRNQRIEIIKTVLRALDGAYADIVIFACAVHKQSFKDQDPVEMAFEEISNRFAIYLRRKTAEKSANQRGLIVLDKSTYETSLQSLATKYRKDGNRWGNELREICEVPLFVDSKASRVVQLADHIAYAVFRRYNADDLTYFQCIEDRFDTNNAVIHGLVHLQKKRTNCTCPACLSRAITSQRPV